MPSYVDILTRVDTTAPDALYMVQYEVFRCENIKSHYTKYFVFHTLITCIAIVQA